VVRWRKEIMNIPILNAIIYDEFHVKVWCEHCNTWHYHGRKGGSGHRSAHCTNRNSPYKITGYEIRWEEENVSG
jgi:hypothetical protein